MPRILLGVFYALVASIGFSLLASLLICCGANPESRVLGDAVSPLLGIFAGAYFASRDASWKIGFWIGLIFVGEWVLFWMYTMGRWNPVRWIEEGLPHLTVTHVVWWGLAIVSGIMGAFIARRPSSVFCGIILLVVFVLTVLMFASNDASDVTVAHRVAGFRVERVGPKDDQTVVYCLTFDFAQEKRFQVGVYDCDSDDASPCDDSNTTYMGQSLDSLINKLDQQARTLHRQVLCVTNGGFFGASGLSVAHHEEPIVEEGNALYNVDKLRPRDQACFFAVNSATSVLAGRPRFSLRSSIPWTELGNYQTVLGGVRPLREDGRSMLLAPGAGATTLKCSRTSVGWSADGSKFYILVVNDVESEAVSQLRRKLHWAHAGGWDVRDVQRFWEEKDIPFAVLFDGGESTQLAYRQDDEGFRYILSGYQYSYTLGYLFERPLLATLPILPPSEGRRGVLNYLYVDGPGS